MTAAPARTTGALAPAAGAVLLLTLVLAGCTTDGQTTSLTAHADVQLTPLVEAPQCTVRQRLGREKESDLPVGHVFGTGAVGSIQVNDQFERGRDAGNESACSRELPEPGGTSCAQPVPWTSLDVPDLLDAFGAYRMRRASFSSAEPGKNAITAARLVTYVDLDILPDDPKGASAYLEQVLKRCGNAVPGTVGGVRTMVGTGTSEHRPNRNVPVAAFLTSARVAWVVLDGREWTTAETEHALRTIAARLA